MVKGKRSGSVSVSVSIQPGPTGVGSLPLLVWTGLNPCWLRVRSVYITTLSGCLSQTWHRRCV